MSQQFKVGALFPPYFQKIPPAAHPGVPPFNPDVRPKSKLGNLLVPFIDRNGNLKLPAPFGPGAPESYRPGESPEQEAAVNPFEYAFEPFANLFDPNNPQRDPKKPFVERGGIFLINLSRAGLRAIEIGLLASRPRRVLVTPGTPPSQRIVGGTSLPTPKGHPPIRQGGQVVVIPGGPATVTPIPSGQPGRGTVVTGYTVAPGVEGPVAVPISRPLRPGEAIVTFGGQNIAYAATLHVLEQIAYLLFQQQLARAGAAPAVPPNTLNPGQAPKPPDLINVRVGGSPGVFINLPPSTSRRTTNLGPDP